jgi:uncharacterized membrane protein
MAGPQPTVTDERIDALLSTLLMIGVYLAAAVVLVGGVAFLVHQGSSLPNYRLFRGEPADLREVRLILRGAEGLSARALIQLGLLLLVLTPIARVAFSAMAFARQRDGIFVALTLVVLGVLLYNLLS